jgi:predicted nucleic acid-binding protein
MKKMRFVVVDADAIIALVNEDDGNHAMAIRISEMLIQQKTEMIVPMTAVCEAITALKRVVGKPELTSMIIAQCENEVIPVVSVTKDMLSLANTFFDPKSSKQDTFFDALIAAFAEKYQADAIFSFDKWYRKKGMTLVSEFLET